MEVFEAVRTVLAVRQYQDKPIPPEIMRRIVEAAHLSASSMNRQPWHFIAVDDRDILRQLGSIAQTGPYIAQAPLGCLRRQPGGAVDDANGVVGRHRLKLGGVWRAGRREADPRRSR